MTKTQRCMHGKAYWTIDGCTLRVVHDSDGRGYLYTFSTEKEAREMYDSVTHYMTWGPAGFPEWPHIPVKWERVR